MWPLATTARAIRCRTGCAHVDFPASSPYVLACGGTTLHLSSTGLTGETVWNNGGLASVLGAGGASGGGISERNAVPSWQQGIVPASANPGHARGRGVPDVAGNSDETTGYVIQADGQSMPGVGGTSAVSPLWAGLIARINQHLGKPVGFINPLLYSQFGKTAAFHDVTSGNNDPTGGQLGGYNAGRGWDACTGWGSPDGTRLLNALDPSHPIPVSPTSEPLNPSVGALLGNTGLLIGIAAVIVIAAIIFFSSTTASCDAHREHVEDGDFGREGRNIGSPATIAGWAEQSHGRTAPKRFGHQRGVSGCLAHSRHQPGDASLPSRFNVSIILQRYLSGDGMSCG